MDKLIYDGWLKLYKREVKDREYEIVKNHDAVSAIVLNEENEILLVRQFRPAVMKETYEIPAGVLDIEGEEVEDCLIRELQEETALNVEKADIKKIVSYKPILGFSASTMNMFLVNINKGDFDTNKIQDEDVLEGTWVSFNGFENMVLSGEIIDDKTIMAYFYLKSLN